MEWVAYSFLHLYYSLQPSVLFLKSSFNHNGRKAGCPSTSLLPANGKKSICGCMKSGKSEKSLRYRVLLVLTAGRNSNTQLCLVMRSGSPASRTLQTNVYRGKLLSTSTWLGILICNKSCDIPYPYSLLFNFTLLKGSAYEKNF